MLCIAALATRCLEVIILHIPTFKEHFEERLPPKQYILLSQFDQILKVRPHEIIFYTDKSVSLVFKDQKRGTLLQKI